MVIRTFEHEYPIIGVKENTEKYDSYICRDVASSCMCRIMSIKDRSLFPELASWLTDNIKREAFTDYREFFIYDDKLCIVMKYTEGTTLSKKLSTESVPLRERLELGRRLLEKIVLQDIPDYFLAGCMTPEQIVVEKDLSISFNYPIEDILTGREQNGRKNIETVFRLIFDRELQRKVPEVLMKFFEKLPVLLSGRMIDLYSEYYLLMGALEGYNENNDEPKTFWFKLWKKIRKILGILKKIVIFALIALSVWYLIYLIIDPDKNKSSNGHFHSIGLVEIKNDG